MYIIGIIFVIWGAFLFFDWHSRCVFVACGYPHKYGHGKTWKRARKHYKENWSFVERMLWIPIFKEKYDIRFKIVAFLSYFHFFFSIITSIVIILDELVFVRIQLWHYLFGVYTLFFIFRFCYVNAIGRDKI